MMEDGHNYCFNFSNLLGDDRNKSRNDNNWNINFKKIQFEPKKMFVELSTKESNLQNWVTQIIKVHIFIPIPLEPGTLTNQIATMCTKNL